MNDVHITASKKDEGNWIEYYENCLNNKLIKMSGDVFTLYYKNSFYEFKRDDENEFKFAGKLILR